MKIYSNDAERVLKNCHLTDLGCWEWTLTTRSGYGSVTTGSRADGTRRRMSAHILSFKTFVGEVPDGMIVCHKCDNRKCVNPQHLFLGTFQDNIDDREKKGRNVVQYGRCNKKSKFTENDVARIREEAKEGVTFRGIARDMGCHHSSISAIVNGSTWMNGSCAKHYLPEPPKESEE